MACFDRLQTQKFAVCVCAMPSSTSRRSLSPNFNWPMTSQASLFDSLTIHSSRCELQFITSNGVRPIIVHRLTLPSEKERRRANERVTKSTYVRVVKQIKEEPHFGFPQKSQINFTLYCRVLFEVQNATTGWKNSQALDICFVHFWEKCILFFNKNERNDFVGTRTIIRITQSNQFTWKF